MLNKENFSNKMKKIKELDEKVTRLISLGFDINSEIIEIISSFCHEMIKKLEEEMEDKFSTIDWYIYENEWGKRNFTITHHENKIEKEYVFKNENDLYDYLCLEKSGE